MRADWFSETARRFVELRVERATVKRERLADRCEQLSANASPCWREALDAQGVRDEGFSADEPELCPACKRNGLRRNRERVLARQIGGSLAALTRVTMAEQRAKEPRP